MKVLAGDIGGTKTLLAVLETDTKPFRLVREERFESPRFEGLEGVVKAFFAKGREEIGAACFAIAGPVKAGEVRMSNLAWTTVSERRLATELNLPRTRLVNDFGAVGYGIEQLGPEDLATLQAGKPDPTGPIAVLGAGTGLGEAFLLWDGAKRVVHASEGGHVDFAPRTALEADLLQFLAKEHGHVSYERVVSGMGIANIFRFLSETKVEKPSADVLREMKTEDPAAVVSRHALAKTDRCCERALDVFASIYGAQAGNLALTILATGGVYVAGGIAPRNLTKLKDGTFVRAFRDKGRLSGLVESIPVHVILNTRIGLLGAASLAARP
jgi:glucokinase